MDYVPGKTLAEIMQEVGGHVNWRVAVVWGIALCDVLAYLHARTPPIVFRDMKLQNVMIDSRTTRPVLIDFGITRQLAPTGGTAIGTWGYVPYEQITGRAEPRSDIYSLGATLHALVTGRYPDMEYARLLRSGLSVDKAMRLLFPSADTLLADVPLALAQVLTCATSFDATSRYGDASSLATALKQAHHHPSQPLNTQHQVPTTPSSSPSSSQGKSAAGSSGPIPTQSPTPMTTAHEAEHGHMRVQVKRFDVNLKAKPYEPQHGFTYFVLRLLITNEGTTNARYDARAFELQGADSVKYSSMAGFFSHSELAAGILAPGKSVAGDILYTAPTNQQYELLWTVEYPLAPITITLP